MKANKVRIAKSLYRSLLRAAAPFTASMSNTASSSSKRMDSCQITEAVLLNCLLERVGRYDDWIDNNDMDNITDFDTAVVDSDSATEEEEEQAEEQEESKPDDQELLFGQLLREIISGNPTGGTRLMRFPQHCQQQEDITTTNIMTTIHDNPHQTIAYDTSQLRRIIQREFRSTSNNNSNNLSSSFSEITRKQVAFTTLRCLNETAQFYQDLKATAPIPHPRQAAWNVQPLTATAQAAQQYLQPGIFLIAHPKLTGYFRRTVICLLDHHPLNGTYGLIVNRVFPNNNNSNNNNNNTQYMTLQDTFSNLPQDFLDAFGDCIVKDGGPVHASLQMMHSVAPDIQDTLKLGGHVLSSANVHATQDNEQKADNASLTTTTTTENHGQQQPNVIPSAYTTDHAICFAGDIRNAASAAMAGRLNAERDVSFFAGSSGWSPQQLEQEIEQGVWLPCRGPPQLAFRGQCDWYNSNDNDDDDDDQDSNPQNQASDSKTTNRIPPAQRQDDLWLSMLSACSKEDEALAHLLWTDDGEHPLGGPCDSQ